MMEYHRPPTIPAALIELERALLSEDEARIRRIRGYHPEGLTVHDEMVVVAPSAQDQKEMVRRITNVWMG